MCFVGKMRGLVMLMAAVSLFAASVSACACPTHAHAKPRPEKSSCHSHSDEDASDRSNFLAADGTCSCGESGESLAITPKPEKQSSPSARATESANSIIRVDD